MAGGRRERVTAAVCLPCVPGDIPSFGKGGRHFRIDRVCDSTIVLSVLCANPKYDRSWHLEKGEKALYRPRSCDGGYYYTFKLK